MLYRFTIYSAGGKAGRPLDRQEERVKTLGKASVSSVLRWAVEVAWYVAIIGAIAVYVEGGRALIGGPAGLRLDLPIAIELEPAAHEIVSQQLAIESARIDDVTGMLKLHVSSRGLVAVWLVLASAWLGALLAVVYQLRKIFRTLAAGDPFVRENASRIRFIGLVIVCMELFETLLVLGFSYYLRTVLDISSISLQSDFRLSPEILFLGFVFVVIAEVFRRGAEMREEQALTV